MRRFLFYCLSAFLLVPATAFAVCSQPKIRVNDEFFTSEDVFEGTIVSDTKLGLDAQGNYAAHRFGWRIKQVFRGDIKPGDILQTYSEDDSGRFPPEAEEPRVVGMSFLTFAYKSQSGLVVDSCGNSTYLSHATSVRKAIEAIPLHAESHIYGWVLANEASPAEKPIRITITSLENGNSFTVPANTDGNFDVKVKPGHYKVVASAPGLNITQDELRYKDANDVVAPKNGSAGVAFTWTLSPQH